MPRKTDGMLFELQPRPTSGEDGKPLLYARPAAPVKRTMKEQSGGRKVRRFCSARCKMFARPLQDVSTFAARC